MNVCIYIYVFIYIYKYTIMFIVYSRPPSVVVSAHGTILMAQDPRYCVYVSSDISYQCVDVHVTVFNISPPSFLYFLFHEAYRCFFCPSVGLQVFYMNATDTHAAF